MDKNTRGTRILKTTGSFPHCLPPSVSGWVLFPYLSPLTLLLSPPHHPSGNLPLVPKEPKLSLTELHYVLRLVCLGCRMRGGHLAGKAGAMETDGDRREIGLPTSP